MSLRKWNFIWCLFNIECACSTKNYSWKWMKNILFVRHDRRFIESSWMRLEGPIISILLVLAPIIFVIRRWRCCNGTCIGLNLQYVFLELLDLRFFMAWVRSTIKIRKNIFRICIIIILISSLKWEYIKLTVFWVQVWELF